MPAGVFLTDLGLAKDIRTGSRYTRSGETLGTPAYMPPEQARGEIAALAPASDVWALGCVLFECCAGAPAFEGESSVEIVGKVVAGRAPSLRRTRPDLPAAVDAIVARCLAAAVGSRYAHGAALRDDCARLLAGGAPIAGRARRRRRVAALAACGVVAALAGVAAWGARERRRSQAADGAAEAARVWERRHADPAAAAEALTALLRAHPDLHAVRLDLGVLLWGLARVDEARAAWTAVPADAPEAPAARFFLGLEALVGLRPDEAGPHLVAGVSAPGEIGRLARAAIAVGTDEWDRARAALVGRTGWIADLLRGLVEDKAPGGDPAEALRGYEAAVAGGVPLAWVHLHRGRLLRLRRDYPGAITAFEAALRLRPGYRKAEFGLAFACIDGGQVARGLELLDRLVEGDPGDAEARLERAQYRLIARRPADALADADTALAHGPATARLHEVRGRALVMLGRHRDALAAFDAALALAPEARDPLIARAASRAELGLHDAAREDLDLALRRDPRDVLALTNRATLRVHQGDLVGAEADAEAALAIDPHTVDALAWRGYLRSGRGDVAGALADYAAVLAIEPRHAMVLVNRGGVRARAGDDAGAVADFQAAVAADPTLPVAWLNLGLAHVNAQAWADAVAPLEQFLRLAPADDPARATADEALAWAREQLAAGDGR